MLLSGSTGVDPGEFTIDLKGLGYPRVPTHKDVVNVISVRVYIPNVVNYLMQMTNFEKKAIFRRFVRQSR